jgi:hypothetical protein
MFYLEKMNSTTNENCPDTFNQIYFYSMAFVSCSLNAILFYLIRTKTHTLMKPYLKILYSSVVLDFISSLIQSLTQTVSRIHTDYVIYFYIFIFKRPILAKTGVMAIAMDGLVPWLVKDWAIFEGGNLNFIFAFEYFVRYSIRKLI